MLMFEEFSCFSHFFFMSKLLVHWLIAHLRQLLRVTSRFHLKPFNNNNFRFLKYILHDASKTMCSGWCVLNTYFSFQAANVRAIYDFDAFRTSARKYLYKGISL